jgi:hypothetical protein
LAEKVYFDIIVVLIQQLRRIKMPKSALSPGKVQQTRQEILTHIGLIEEMRRGSVTRQFLKIKLKGQKDPALAGPYALFTCKKNGRTVGRRLRDAQEIRRLEHQVQNFHTFQNLCRRLVEISEKICEERERKEDG